MILIHKANRIRVMRMAENMDEITPTEMVTENPLIGPDPMRKRQSAAANVVRLASIIVPVA